MEDLATGRMSVAQIAQRIRHAARTTQGPEAIHDAALVKRLLQEECDDILRLAKNKDPETEARYRKAVKIALQWIKNYTELDYRSLGSYTRADLEKIAAGPDAL
jgi:malate synthase